MSLSGMAPRVFKKLEQASPGRRWGRKRRNGASGRPRRILAVDLVSSTTRYSRWVAYRERQAQARATLLALVLVAGGILALLMFT